MNPWPLGREESMLTNRPESKLEAGASLKSKLKFLFQGHQRHRTQELQGLERPGMPVGRHQLLLKPEQPGSLLGQAAVDDVRRRRRRRRHTLRATRKKAEKQIVKTLQHPITSTLGFFAV